MQGHLRCLQAYYLQAPFAVERAPTLPILGWPGVKGAPHLRVMQLTEYPVNGLVFESSVDVDAMADYVAGVCVRLQQANVPHNLFVADSGARVFLYPNAFAQAKAEVSVLGSEFCLHCLWSSALLATQALHTGGKTPAIAVPGPEPASCTSKAPSQISQPP